MTVPAPCHCSAIIGHEAAQKQLLASLDSGRLHHAWLITGAEGIGKASLAYLFATTILSGGAVRPGRANPDHPAARLIAAESHPDLFVLQRPFDEKTGIQKNAISVDDARKLPPFLRMTASQGQGRVAIIDEAHTMNRNAQNAILKSIEEPPSGVTILMTATTVGSLLPTIRSRCRVLPLETLSAPALETILARVGVERPPEITAARLLELSGGSVGLAIKLIETEIVPLWEELLQILGALPQLDLLKIHKFADKIGRKGEIESFRVLTNLLTDRLRQAVRAAALGQNDETGLAVKFTAAGRLDKALNLWEKTRQTFAQADTANLDNKLALINALSEISRVLS